MTQAAVNNAVSAGGTEYAPVEMKSAQDKLKQAEMAMHDKNYKDARRLSEQSGMGCPRSERKAQAAKAEGRTGCSKPSRNCVRKVCAAFNKRCPFLPLAQTQHSNRYKGQILCVIKY